MAHNRIQIGELPWGSDVHIFDITTRLNSFQPKTAIDIGCGLMHTPISKNLRDYPFERLDLLDFFPPYIEALRGQRRTFAAKEVDFFIGDAKRVMSIVGERRYNFAWLGDIAEHLHPDDSEDPELSRQCAFKFLEDVCNLAEHVILWVPINFCPVDSDQFDVIGQTNVAGHRHFSTFTVEDFTSRSWSIEYWHGFHNTHASRYYEKYGRTWDCHAAYCYRHNER